MKAVRQIYKKEMQFEKNLVNCWMIETNAPTNRGDSGGPIVNDRGQLIAIVQGGIQGNPDDQQRLVSYNVDVREIHFILGEYYKTIGKTYELPQLSDVDPNDLLALTKKLDDPSASVRLQAVKAIGEHGADARALVQPLVKALSDTDATVRLQIGKSLELIGPPPVEQSSLLLDLAKGGSGPEAKRYAALMLGRPNVVKKELALAALLDLAKDADLETRRRAVAGIGPVGLGDKKNAGAALIERLGDEDAEIRASAASGLGQLGADVRADALPKLISALSDGDTAVALAASTAILAMGDPAESDLPLLLKTLQSKKTLERSAALDLLVKLGPKAKDALPHLLSYLKDSDMPVRLKAIALAGALRKEGASLVPALSEMLSEEIKQEGGDATAPIEAVGDARLREVLLRSVCMVMSRDAAGVRPPSSAFVVHVGQRLILAPNDAVANQKVVLAFFPIKTGGNLITQARQYISNANAIGIPGQVVASNPKANLAVIQLMRLPPGAEALPLAAKTPSSGVKVASITVDSFDRDPMNGIFWQLHSGMVKDVMPLKTPQAEGYFVIIDGILSKNDSGSHLMDEQGNVVAIGMEAFEVTLKNKSKLRASLGVDVREVRPVLDEYFQKIGGSFRDSATRASAGNVTQNNFRVAVAKALADMGPDAAEAKKALQLTHKDKSAKVRAQAARALAALGKVAADAVPDMLRASITEPNPEVMEQSIAKLGKDAVAPLIKELKDTNIEIKKAAMRTLGRIGQPAQSAIPALSAYLRVPIPDVAQAALLTRLEKIKR